MVTVMDKRDLLTRQLEQYYNWIISDKNQSVTTRCWCVTVWIATVAFVSSNKVHLDSLGFTIIIHLPVLLFWILDGFQNSFITLNEQQAQRIEEALALDNVENVDLLKHLLMSSHNNTSFFSKVRVLFSCLFLQETIFFFYLILLIASVVMTMLIPR